MSGQVANAGGLAPVACFDVLFDRDVPLYFPEDDVNGSVKITLNQPLRLANLKLLFRGRARFENVPSNVLSIGRGSREGARSVCELNYFDKEVVLVDRLPGKEDTGEFVLPTGDHLIPYTFPLPKRLISSYEGKYGSIRYYCQAIISRTGGSSYVTERPFTVLNRDSTLSSNGAASAAEHLLKPAVHSDSEKVTTCCTSGLISCELTLPKLIYYPGEAVIASLQVVNDSRSALSRVTARLVQNETCYSQAEPNVKVATSSRGVVESELDKRLAGRNKKSWPNEFLLTIPSVPPTSDVCPILHVSYELQMELVFSSRSSQILSVQAPIHIGSPLELSSTTSTDSATAAAAAVASDEGSKGRLVDSKDLSPGDRPFKFVQCVFGPSIVELAANPSPLNRVEFTPVYPVLMG